MSTAYFTQDNNSILSLITYKKCRLQMNLIRCVRIYSQIYTADNQPSSNFYLPASAFHLYYNAAGRT
jgi:hypothetical protein